MHSLASFDDVQYAINHIHISNPESPIVAVGASTGGGLLLNSMTYNSIPSPIKAAVVISTPFDHVISKRALNSWWPYLKYPDSYILRGFLSLLRPLELYAKDNYKAFEEKGIDLEAVKQVSSTVDFDREITIKMLGFKNVECYYREASPVNALHKVKIPVLALNSLDDPIVNSECIPFEEFRSNPHLVLATTRVGGHLGWFTGNNLPQRWFPKPAFEFLESALHQTSK